MVAVALATRLLEQRGSIPRLGPTARQRARPAELSGRQGHFWGLVVKLDLEGGLILSRSQLVSLLCRWLACVAGLTSRCGLLNDSR